MLVEHGYVRAQAPNDLREWSFAPSFARVALLGSGAEIVAAYAGLHDPAKAQRCALEVLAAFCEQDDPFDLIGWAEDGAVKDGLMSARERLIIARHLMQHAVCGLPAARKADDRASYSPDFNVSKFIGVARIHLEMSEEEASALSMSELQHLLEIKFPGKTGMTDRPSRAEYERAMRASEERARV